MGEINFNNTSYLINVPKILSFQWYNQYKQISNKIFYILTFVLSLLHLEYTLMWTSHITKAQ